MLRFVGEGHDFGLDARTVTRADALDLSVEKGRVGQSFPERVVYLFVGKAGPALQLFQVARFADKREAVEIILAVLCIHQVKVYALSVDAHRGTRLHASGRNAVAGDGFSQVIRCRFRTASSCQHLVSDVHQTVQESTGSQHHAFGMKRHSPASHQAGHFAVLHQQLFHRILPDMQVGQVL